MDMSVKFTTDGAEESIKDGYVELLLGGGEALDGAIVQETSGDIIELMQSSPGGEKRVQKPKVKDISRLWLYRNGGSPED